jgi:glycosyltransferase involved in cell wall biosynthesis
VSDCLVSLHRSEGLGLHCAEAMWLGKPVVATRYSGNLDFMDDGNSFLVDHTLVPVRHGEGVYPADAVWADPDLDQAADHLRRLATDPDLGRRVGARARAAMARQPSPAVTGRMIARTAGLGPYEPDPATLHRRDAASTHHRTSVHPPCASEPSEPPRETVR